MLAEALGISACQWLPARDICLKLSSAFGSGALLASRLVCEGLAGTSAERGTGHERHGAQAVPPEHMRSSHLPVHLGFHKKKGLPGTGRLRCMTSSQLPSWVEGMVLPFKS